MTFARRFHQVALAFIAVGAACAVQAQTGVYGQTANRASLIPGTSNGWVGISLGRSTYNLDQGVGAYNFDDTDTAFKLSTGAMMNPNFGVELGYNHMGKTNRAGGTTKAQGVDLAAIAKAPLGNSFDIFGKLGTTYGFTRTSSAVGSGVQGGKENGFGLLYGVGASYYFTPQVAAVLELESRDFRFAGTGRDSVRATTVGLQYRY